MARTVLKWKQDDWNVVRFPEFLKILNIERAFRFHLEEPINKIKLKREIIRETGADIVVVKLPNPETCISSKTNYLVLRLTFNSGTKDLEKQKLIVKNLNKKILKILEENFYEFKGNWNYAN